MSARPTAEDRAKLIKAWGGPLAPDVDFIEVRDGRVHVEAYNPDETEGVPVTAEGLTDLLVGAVWTFCGQRLRKHIGGHEHSAGRTLRFADERLCRRCVAAVPAPEQWRLFEHEQPNDPEDD